MASASVTLMVFGAEVAVFSSKIFPFKIPVLINKAPATSSPLPPVLIAEFLMNLEFMMFVVAVVVYIAPPPPPTLEDE